MVMWRLKTPFAVGGVMVDEWGNVLPWASAPVFRKWLSTWNTIDVLKREAEKRGWKLASQEEDSITALASHDEDDSPPIVWQGRS